MREFGKVAVEATARSSSDDLGALLDAEDRLRVSVPLSGRLNFALDAAENYADTVGAYNENGAMLTYGGAASNASASYRAGHYEYGLLQDSRITAAFSVPGLGAVDLAHRQTNFYGFALQAVQQSTSAGLQHKFGKDTSVALSYRYASGQLPMFLQQSTAPYGGVSFSLDRYVKAGLLHFSINRQTSALAAPASFSIKLIPGASM